MAVTEPAMSHAFTPGVWPNIVRGGIWTFAVFGRSISLYWQPVAGRLSRNVFVRLAQSNLFFWTRFRVHRTRPPSICVLVADAPLQPARIQDPQDNDRA